MLVGFCYCLLLVSVLHSCDWWVKPARNIIDDPGTEGVLASNMNYTCVCVGTILLAELIWWKFAGKSYEEAMEKAREQGQDVPLIDMKGDE